MGDTPRTLDFVHYYGDFIWDEELNGWVKSLLLFFDGIALVLPDVMAERLIESNPVLAQPLAELGLLRNYDPYLWLKPSMQPPPNEFKQHLAEIAKIFSKTPESQGLSDKDVDEAVKIIDAGGFSEVWRSFGRRLDRAIEEFGDTPLRTRVLGRAIITRLLQRNIADVAIQPVIEDENAASFVRSVIGSHDDGRARIVQGDLVQIGLDLSAIPLDEVLAFRSEHGSEYRMYARDVRQFVLELSLMDEVGQRSALTDRRAELHDRGEQLRRAARRVFARQAISFGFGFAGAAWLLRQGDPWGAAFAAGAATAGLTMSDRGTIGAAYTYILRANTELTR